MLSIIMWCGESISSTCQKKRVNLYLRLGGKFLGCLDLSWPSDEVWKRLDYLQEQASKLFLHVTRGFRDVLLYVDGTVVVPRGYAYHDNVPADKAKLICNITTSSRVEMLWNEDDSYAQRLIRNSPIKLLHHEYGDNMVMLGLVPGLVVPREFLWFENTVTSWMMFMDKHYTHQADLKLFRHARKVKTLRLLNCMPLNWQDCNVPELHLTLEGMLLDARVLAKLDRLEVLTVCSQATHVEALVALPRLRRLEIRDENNTTFTFEGQELTNFLRT